MGATDSQHRFTHRFGRRIIITHLLGVSVTGIPFYPLLIWSRCLRLLDKTLSQCRLRRSSVLVAILVAQGCMSSATRPTPMRPSLEPVAETTVEKTSEPNSLMGEWCREKKRKVTKYTVKEDQLRIRSGRSGQLYEADLSCDEAYTECKAKTIRGWGTPVTEILRLDGENMNLTRVWGGAWKDKTYNFTYTRCPKW